MPTMLDFAIAGELQKAREGGFAAGDESFDARNTVETSLDLGERGPEALGEPDEVVVLRWLRESQLVAGEEQERAYVVFPLAFVF